MNKTEHKDAKVHITTKIIIAVLVIFYPDFKISSLVSITCFIDSCDFLYQIFFYIFCVFKSCTDSVKLV